MTPLFQNPDGAEPQAQAVLAYIRMRGSGIESSWNPATHRYDAEPFIGRWYNGREDGYVISLRLPGVDTRQINIAFFEHRNSDRICALIFYAITKYREPPTIESIPLSHRWLNDKYAVDLSFGVGDAIGMANAICERLEQEWRGAKARASGSVGRGAA